MMFESDIRCSTPAVYIPVSPRLQGVNRYPDCCITHNVKFKHGVCLADNACVNNNVPLKTKNIIYFKLLNVAIHKGIVVCDSH